MKTKLLLALSVSAGLSVYAPVALADEEGANISKVVPATSQGINYHADGSMSAQVGPEHIKLLVATRNEDGELVFSHQEPGDVDLEVSTTPAEEEE